MTAFSKGLRGSDMQCLSWDLKDEENLLRQKWKMEWMGGIPGRGNISV